MEFQSYIIFVQLQCSNFTVDILEVEALSSTQLMLLAVQFLEIESTR